MKPKRIVLITGCNGRIGSAVMARLTGHFSDVVGFDRNAPAPPPPDCVRIPVDIASDDSVREGLRILREHHGTHAADPAGPANRIRIRGLKPRKRPACEVIGDVTRHIEMKTKEAR